MKYAHYLANYILSFLYDIYYYFFGNIRARIFGFEYYKKSKLYPDYLKQGNMAEAVGNLVEIYCQGKGIDIGPGQWPIKNARIIENSPDENGYKIKEDDNALDFVFSSHSLEHLDRWKEALSEWHRVLKQGGIMLFYLPHPACSMWKPRVNKQHFWSPTAAELADFFSNELKMQILRQTELPDGFLSFVVVARK